MVAEHTEFDLYWCSGVQKVKWQNSRAASLNGVHVGSDLVYYLTFVYRNVPFDAHVYLLISHKGI